MKLNKIQQLAAGFALIVIAALITYFFVLKNDHATIDSLKSRNQKLQQDIRVAQTIQKSARDLAEEMDYLERQLNRLKKVLPESVNKPKFMADIKRYANENGLEVLAISNNKPVTDDVIVQHPFTYQSRGSYHDFGGFFAQLSNYSRIINVNGLFLEKLGDPVYPVNASFLVSIFTYEEPSEEEIKKQMEDKRQELKGGKAGSPRR